MHLTRFDMALIQLETRMPFRYGIATMTRMPQLYVRAWVEIDGEEYVGVSADLLPPKWFTKVAAKPLEAEVDEMLMVIRQALHLAMTLEGATPFDWWRKLYDAQERWSQPLGLPPLLAHFGTSIVERAVLEAFCRARAQPLAQLVAQEQLGINLADIHPILARQTPSQLLEPVPLGQITLRHTVGLADPLTDETIPPGERVADGLPQSLAACIRAYGLRHFKIKIQGQPRHDLERLRTIFKVMRDQGIPDFRFSLDGNEQFSSWDVFREFWTEVEHDPELGAVLPKLLFVEQPLTRQLALDPNIAEGLLHWKGRPLIIIDESDGSLGDAAKALQLGYAGTSHKNCKGIFKGIANRCLLNHLNQRSPGREYLMSGEDLCNTGPVSLLQDLAVMATLGITSVERNGHHYNAGLSRFPLPLQENALAHHPDLYARSKAGWPTLRITDGNLSVGSVNRSPFGVGFEVDLDWFEKI